jgi:CHAD domain-containing protein
MLHAPSSSDAAAAASPAAPELAAAHDREAALAHELGRVRADNGVLQAKLQGATDSLRTAKATAREALIDMAEQNAKLVAAYVERKRECKQLKVRGVLCACVG